MRIASLIIACLFFTFSIRSNAQQRCYTTEHDLYLTQQNPAFATAREKYTAQQNKYMLQNPQATSNKSVVTIPVVVHVVYGNNTENISDAQVQSQIAVLNEDFRRANADASNTPAAFQSVAADAQIEFCLATVDPNGNPTNGINRVSTTVSSFSDNDAVKFTSQGGANAWNVTKYFNIWVCDLGGGILGYAEFPTSTPSNTFGVVIGYRYFGRVGTLQAPYNKGRTTTHEVGHCLGLYHIWGDQTCGNDGISDTPPQFTENTGCPSYPRNPNNSCGSTASGEMFMNYMDYTNDNCLNLFTIGQSNRMNSVLNIAPYNQLTSSTACGSNPGGGTTINTNDLSVTAIVSPNAGILCANSITPIVNIQNIGTNTVNGFQLSVTLNNGTPQVYSINGTLSAGDQGQVELDPINVTFGTYTLAIKTQLPNGQVDPNAANDQKSVTFSIESGGVPMPFSQNFSGTTFPPTGFTLSNPDGLSTWGRSTASVTGAGSAYVNNYDYELTSPQIDELLMPTINFGGASQVNLKFDLAYKMYQGTNGTYSDQLKIFGSTDCGATWSLLYDKSGVDLVTSSPVAINTAFTPTTQDQWRNEVVNLSSFASAGFVKLKFQNTSNYANNLYIDNIQVESGNTPDITTSVEFVNDPANQILLFPNPSSQALNIQSPVQISEYQIYSLYGQLLNASSVAGDVFEISVEQLPAGTYFIQLKEFGTEYINRLKFIKE